MARQTLVIDASVGVKWFSHESESALSQALAIKDAHLAQSARITVPDLFYYEVANAIALKRQIPSTAVQSAVSALYALGLNTTQVSESLLANSVRLSRKFNITIYDACYVAIAQGLDCPLVTANPRHQAQALDCQVIPLEQWSPVF